jgi:hypothetical protein
MGIGITCAIENAIQKLFKLLMVFGSFVRTIDG